MFFIWGPYRNTKNLGDICFLFFLGFCKATPRVLEKTTTFSDAEKRSFRADEVAFQRLAQLVRLCDRDFTSKNVSRPRGCFGFWACYVSLFVFWRVVGLGLFFLGGVFFVFRVFSLRSLSSLEFFWFDVC